MTHLIKKNVKYATRWNKKYIKITSSLHKMFLKKFFFIFYLFNFQKRKSKVIPVCVCTWKEYKKLYFARTDLKKKKNRLHDTPACALNFY
jgi:hypothetical protein